MPARRKSGYINRKVHSAFILKLVWKTSFPYRITLNMQAGSE